MIKLSKSLSRLGSVEPLRATVTAWGVMSPDAVAQILRDHQRRDGDVRIGTAHALYHVSALIVGDENGNRTRFLPVENFGCEIAVAPVEDDNIAGNICRVEQRLATVCHGPLVFCHRLVAAVIAQHERTGDGRQIVERQPESGTGGIVLSGQFRRRGDRKAGRRGPRQTSAYATVIRRAVWQNWHCLSLIRPVRRPERDRRPILRGRSCCVEVARRFVKAVAVKYVVQYIVPVKQVDDGCGLIGVFIRFDCRVEEVIENQVVAAIRPKTTDIIPVHVFLCKYVIATGIGEFCARRAVSVVPAVG